MYDGDIVLLDEFGGRCTAVGVCCNHNVDAIKRSGVCHACRAVIDYVFHLLVGADGVHSCNHALGRIVEVEEEFCRCSTPILGQLKNRRSRHWRRTLLSI